MENTTKFLNIAMNKIEFSWYDYCLFTFMLGSSVLIGIYFGCFGKKQNTASEYLLGGKTMTIFPVAMSLVASDTSGITILAIPADIYKFGTSYAVTLIGVIINCFIAAYITMPVFHKLEITSTYEYLQLRFDNKIRTVGSILFTISVFLYLPIVIYGPALAFSQATSVNLHMVNPIICTICIFYTTIGGLKAVVWTDALQFSIMIGAMLTVLYLGTSAVGDLGVVFDRALKGERLDIDFDINPTKRDTFWAVFLGWTTYWIPLVPTGQGSVQKFLALPNMADVKKCMIVFCIGTLFCKAASILTGLIIYAKYYNCDPFTKGMIHKNDQLLPYFIMDVGNKIPGFPGLFIAGVFCAALSTMSAYMNSLSGTLYEDFISKLVSKNITQTQVSNILKLTVVIIGIISTGLVFVIERLGGILALAIAVSGVSAGPLLGLFTLGMIFPSANSKGALVGSITSLMAISWMLVGAQMYQATGAMSYIPKPTSADGCMGNSTTIEENIMAPTVTEVSLFYRISFYYYALIGALIVLTVGLPISWLTRNEKEEVNERLITPCMRWAIPKSSYKKKRAYDISYHYELTKLNNK